jgi:hypothetical protein
MVPPYADYSIGQEIAKRRITSSNGEDRKGTSGVAELLSNILSCFARNQYNKCSAFVQVKKIFNLWTL